MENEMKALYDTVVSRKTHAEAGSYTAYLYEKGLEKILKKVGEECTEVIIGGKNEGKDEVIYEVSDLLYHLMVLMVEKGVTWQEIYDELEKRHGQKELDRKYKS